MKILNLTKLLILVYTVEIAKAADYTLEIFSNAPAVSGAVVNFTAKIYTDGKMVNNSYKYVWFDDTVPRHERTSESESPQDTFSVNYTNPAATYMMQLEVYGKYYIIPYRMARNYTIFSLTEHLNGYLELSQDSKVLGTKFVSNSTTVSHRTALTIPDAQFLNNTATSVLTYWFIDCNYQGMTDNMQFTMNYTTPGKKHKIDALVLPSFEPLPTPPPPTTTSTTIRPTQTTTTVAPNNITSTTTTMKSKVKREADIVAKLNGAFISLKEEKELNDTFPYICNNNTIIPISSNRTYGLFGRNIIVKQPVGEVKVTGNNWIQHYEMLDLNVTCQGSSNFKYCHIFKDGIYNVTGNETCIDYNTSEKCEFPIQRLFVLNNADKHTVVIIIHNDVSNVIYPVTVTFYQVTKQAQLSVIVVPVAFSLVAVVLIVFGVAYYFQNRSRFVVEVADFNFGQQYADMEYKSFRERLRDSIANALTRAPIPVSSEGPIWPPGNKYGSMT